MNRPSGKQKIIGLSHDDYKAPFVPIEEAYAGVGETPFVWVMRHSYIAPVGEGIEVLMMGRDGSLADEPIGLLSWWKGTIDRVQVADEHRRRGLASLMLSFAREIAPGLQHSPNLTEDGEAWSQVVGSKTAGPGGGVVPHRFRYKGPQWNLQQARPVVVAPQAMQDINNDITPRERIKVWEAIAAIEEGRARLEPKKRGPLVGTYGLRIDEDCRLLVYPNVDGKWHVFWVGQHTYGEAERRMASLETEARSGGDDRGNSYARRARKVWLLNHFGTGYAVKCNYCPRILDYDTVEADRVVPGEEGGRYVRENIVPACRQCNASRGHDTDWVLDWDEMWEEYGLEKAAISLDQELSGLDLPSCAVDGDCLWVSGRIRERLRSLGYQAEIVYVTGMVEPGIPGFEGRVVGWMHVVVRVDGKIVDGSATQYDPSLPSLIVALEGEYLRIMQRATGAAEVILGTPSGKTAGAQEVDLSTLKFDPSWGDAVDRYQYNYRARVTLPDGSQVASMEVSWFKHPSYAPDGEAKVEMIEVDEEYRRQGIAAWLYQKMIDHIRSEQPGWDLKDLQHSYMTEDGSALWRSVGPRLSYGDWEDLHAEFPLRGTQRNKVYRAIVFDDIDTNLPAAQRAQIVQQRLEARQSSNRWSHWTWDEEWAEHFATELAAPNYDEKGAWREGLTRVVVEAFLDRSDVEWDPAVLERLRNGFDLPEPEVILRPGSRVYVEAIRIHDHAYSWETFPVRRKVVASIPLRITTEPGSKYKGDSDSRAVVAYHSQTGEMIGWLRFDRTMQSVDEVWVDPRFRRQGVAKAMADRLMRTIPRDEREGWTRTPTTPDGRGFLDGYGVPVPMGSEHQHEMIDPYTAATV